MEYQIRAESGRQLLARLSSRPSLQGLDDRLLGTDGPSSRETIEITGETSVGKSLLVLQWIARAILSPPRGGLGVEVLFIDMDHHQPLFLLVKLLTARMKEFLAQSTNPHLRLSSSQVESSIDDALKRLTILNVYDSTNLHTALFALDKMLPAKPQISMIVVDSLTAYFWADRLSGGIQHMDSYVRRLVSTLQKITHEHKVTLVFTRPSYFQSAAPSRYKSKEEDGVSTVLISLSRLENDGAGEGNKDSSSSSVLAKHENIFNADVRSGYGQNSFKYLITQGGLIWL